MGRAFGGRSSECKCPGAGIEWNAGLREESATKVEPSHEIFLTLLAGRIIIRPTVQRGEDACPGVTHGCE